MNSNTNTDRKHNEALIQRIEQALAVLRSGGIILVTDDFDRENEGDFISLASETGADTVNFMITEGRGLVCQAITAERAEELDLPLMVQKNNAVHETNFTVSIDYLHGTTTGISCADRAATIQAMCSPDTKPEDFGRPGHMFPLIAHPGGLSARRGHTEAAVCLAELTGAYPSGIICEVLNPDGSMARGPELQEIADEHGMPFLSIEEITQYLEISAGLEKSAEHNAQEALCKR
ncbi:3,4-dihydroxy-2-butanone-4-phosphate synthase [Spirochaeta dissipatitropha]